MITVIAKNYVKEGSAEEFKKLAASLIELSQKEEGCIEYNLHQEVSNPNILTFIEQWKDEKAIEFHKNTKHYTETIPLLGALAAQPKEVNLYKVI